MALLSIYEPPLCEAINRFVEVAFKTQDSLFTPGSKIWSPEVRADLYERFVRHLDDFRGGDAIPKYEKQLKGSSSDTIQLAAELLYVQLLTPVHRTISAEKKISTVETILSWSLAKPAICIPEDLKEGLKGGLSKDQSFPTHRWSHLAFILETLNAWDRLETTRREKLFSDAWEFKRFLADIPAEKAKSMREILCFFVHPLQFEAITFGETKEKIAKAFRHRIKSPTSDYDKDILDIRTVLSKEYGEQFSYFQPEIMSQWNRDLSQQEVETDGGDNPRTNSEPNMTALLEQFRQIIVYGPPGTGKTREAKRLALAMLTGKDSPADTNDYEIEEQLKHFREFGRFDLVVFHPAYEYEQFVGGIEPTLREEKLTFKAKEGVFTRLCRTAEKDNQPAVLVIDEINRGNLPKLLGELVYALEYRGHEVRLPFSDERGRNTLIVPKNLYIIATMNSSDRSIGHIDVAIRRRFGLYPLGARPEVVQQVWSSAGDKNYGDRLAALMIRVNKELGIGHDPSAAVELGVGHSYFLPAPKSSVESAKKQVQMKWDYQVRPLLREYAQHLNLDSLKDFFKPLDECLDQP